MTPDSYLILALTAIAVHLISNHRILFTRAQIVEPKVNRALRVLHGRDRSRRPYVGK